MKWLQDSRFSSWIRKSPNSENKAYCNACNCEVAGSVTLLERHKNTSKHIRNLQQQGGDQHHKKAAAFVWPATSRRGSRKDDTSVRYVPTWYSFRNTGTASCDGETPTYCEDVSVFI